MNMMEDDIVQDMSEQEAWEFLESQELGRLAFAVAGYPDIVPINFCATRGKVYFRTAEGSKLLGLTINTRVALETDRVRGGNTALSVIVHGIAREIDTIDEYEFAESLPLRTWLPTRKVHYIEITPEEVTGRRFHLGEEKRD